MGIFSNLGKKNSKLGKGLDTISDFATGFTKGIVDIPREFAELGTDIGTKFSKGIRGEAFTQEDEKPDNFLQKGVEQTEFTKPQNRAEELGFGTEKVAEFFVPTGAGKKVAQAFGKATTTGAKAGQVFGKATPLVKKAGQVFGKKVEPVIRHSTEILADMGITATQEGEINNKVLGAGAIATAFPAAGLVFKGAGNLARGLAKFTSSKLSGVPVSAIEQAWRNPKAVQAAMRSAANSPTEGINVIREKAVDALASLKDARSTAFVRAIKGIDDANLEKLNITGVTSAMDNVFETVRGLKVTSEGIDAGQTTLRKFESELNGISDLVKNWEDTSPLGLNELRKVLDAEKVVGDTGAARNFNRIVGDIKNKVRDFVGDAVPELKKANKEFAIQSDMIDDIVKELGIKEGARKSSIERKLANVFNPKSEVYRDIVEELGEKAGVDLMSDIAGLTMSRLTPEGLAKYFAGSGVIPAGTALALTGNIGPAGVLGASLLAGSPRLIGEVVTGLGKPLKSSVVKNLRTILRDAQAPATKLINDTLSEAEQSPEAEERGGITEPEKDELTIQLERALFGDPLPPEDIVEEAELPTGIEPQSASPPTQGGADVDAQKKQLEELLFGS